jgi:NADH-quinone oxidoreductase subunit G
VQALVVMGHELLDSAYLGDAHALEAVENVILFDTHRSDLERVAHVVVPLRHAAEREGTFTNCAGRVQRIAAAVEPAWDALAGGEALMHLGLALGLEGFEGRFEPRVVSEDLAKAVPAFAETALASLPEQGTPLAGRGKARG